MPKSILKDSRFFADPAVKMEMQEHLARMFAVQADDTVEGMLARATIEWQDDAQRWVSNEIEHQLNLSTDDKDNYQTRVLGIIEVQLRLMTLLVAQTCFSLTDDDPVKRMMLMAVCNNMFTEYMGEIVAGKVQADALTGLVDHKTGKTAVREMTIEGMMVGLKK